MNNLVMRDPVMSELLTDLYFSMIKQEEVIPTVPGLALAIGFNKTADIINTLKAAEEGTCTYPESCIGTLQRALTRIEDHYLQNGLTAKFPAALVKFCLGAYHDRQEKEPVLQNSVGTQNIQIVFEAPPSIALQRQVQLSQQPVIEMHAQ